MATPRDIRRLAFQALYQLDARGDALAEGEVAESAETVLEAILSDESDEKVHFTSAERRQAFKTAVEAYADRPRADAFMVEAAPTWPVHRQAAVDRAILRLAHYEMMGGKVHPKIAVNEAVELAKAFSTEKSPAFVNGLLDKLLKKVLAERGEVAEGDAVEHATHAPPPNSPAT